MKSIDDERRRPLKICRGTSHSRSTYLWSSVCSTLLLLPLVNAHELSELPTQTEGQRHLLQIEDSRCSGIVCSNHGECFDLSGTCLCNIGYTGVDCQLNELSCPNGQLNATGDCCQSGVFDARGRCCGEDSSQTSSWKLDRQGQCCDQELNGCGECGGIGFLDAVGICCAGTLDAGGMCCPSGQLDECGVCDGVGETCSTHLEFVLDEDAEFSEECFLDFLLPLIPTYAEEIELTLEHDDLEPGIGRVIGVDLDGGDIHLPTFEERLDRALRDADDNPCSIQSVAEISKHSLCGNGICELGESTGVSSQYPCQRDCPFRFTPCESRGEDGDVGDADLPCSGNGQCFFAEDGRCECRDGYTGPVCDRCASGYYPLFNMCHQRQPAYFAETENKAEDNVTQSRIQNSGVVILPEQSESDSDDDDNRALIITFVCFGSIALLMLPPCIGYFRGRYKKNKSAKGVGQERDGDHNASTPSLLSNYLKEFREFQDSPPWVGSIENQQSYRPPYLRSSDSPPQLSYDSTPQLRYESAIRLKASSSYPGNLSDLPNQPSTSYSADSVTPLQNQSSKRVSFRFDV